jgi:hypothetical protein
LSREIKYQNGGLISDEAATSPSYTRIFTQGIIDWTKEKGTNMFGLTLIEVIYWASTIIGGTLFILRLGMMLIGGGMSDDGLDSAL